MPACSTVSIYSSDGAKCLWLGLLCEVAIQFYSVSPARRLALVIDWVSEADLTDSLKDCIRDYSFRGWGTYASAERIGVKRRRSASDAIGFGLLFLSPID